MSTPRELRKGVPFSNGAQPPRVPKGNGNPTGTIRPLESSKVQYFGRNKEK